MAGFYEGNQIPVGDSLLSLPCATQSKHALRGVRKAEKDVERVEGSLYLWLGMRACFHEGLLPHFLSVLLWFWLAGGEVAEEGETEGGGRIIKVVFVLCPARDLAWMSDWQVRGLGGALGDAGLVRRVCLFKEKWQQEEKADCSFRAQYAHSLT